MKKFLRVILCVTLALALTLWSCANAKVRQYRLQVVKEYPHDRASYTQGLFFFDGQMYESTGLNGKSTFRKVDITTANGAVTGVVDCTGLLPDKLKYSDTDVLNGIAYNPADGKIYLTGKNWCRLYEVKLVEVR